MKIIINLIGTGAGNNGGSNTIILSANMLQKLGHEVIIIDNGSSKYTWKKIEVPYLKVKDVNDINGDVIIATGIGSVQSTDSSNIKNKFWWIRGLEVWNVHEEKLIKMFKDSPTKKIVNSICLQNKLKQYDIDSIIVRPGYDFNEIRPLDIRKKNKKIILGGLYNEGKKRSTKRTSWIFDCYNLLKEKYSIELYMYGSDGCPSLFVNKYIKNPSVEEKNKLYNMIDIWLAPSELEGLHIPPAEAMLAKCCVVGTEAPLSGSQDYLIDNETGLVSKNYLYSFLSCVEILVKHKTLREELGKKGRNKILSLGSREDNMEKMIEVLNG